MIESLKLTDSSSVSRRGFLQFGLKTAASVALVSSTLTAGLLPTEAAMAAEFSAGMERIAGQIGGNRRLSFKNTHTGERLVTTFWRGGGYDQSALDEINYIMRDFRSGDLHLINTGLLNLLTILRHKLGTDIPVNIISGYRSPKTNAMLRSSSDGVARRSFHMQGMAIDVRMPGIATSGIANTARGLGLGGVGYYSDSDFVHVDVGPKRTW